MVFDAHDKAFQFFGGATKKGIYDNLLCGAPHKRFYVERNIM